MGMSIADVTKVCGAAPKHLAEDMYEITPPDPNQQLATYAVRIDPDYGVYMVKAMSKNIETNSYGDSLTAAFNYHVESIRDMYGEESYRNTRLKEGSIWSNPQYFMHALQKEDRTLCVIWSRILDLTTELRNHPIVLKMIESNKEAGAQEIIDNPTIQSLMQKKIEKYEKLPSDIASIAIEAIAINSFSGYVVFEYIFSNQTMVEEKPIQ
ncbi:hypothetical protein D0T50_09810 [Bacteroides sp. 214]|nr:hypothetical protein [Bacteroides sp. 214]